MKPYLIVAHGRPVTHVRFNSTGELLFSSGKDGVLAAWDAKNGCALGRYEFTLEGSQLKCCWEFDITMDSSRLLAASAEGAFVFNVETGEQIAHCKLSNAGCRAVAWSARPDDQKKFAVVRDNLGQKQGALIVFERTATDAEEPGTAGKEDKYEAVLTISGEDYPPGCMGVGFGPYDETLLTRHESGDVCVWDATTGKLLQRKKIHAGAVTGWDFAKDRYVMLTCSKDQTAKLISVPDLDLISEFKTDRPLNGCSLSPTFDGSNRNFPEPKLIVAGGQDSAEVTTSGSTAKAETLVFNVITGELLGMVGGHFSPANAVHLHPSGKSFVTGAEEGNVKIFVFDS